MNPNDGEMLELNFQVALNAQQQGHFHLRQGRRRSLKFAKTIDSLVMMVYGAYPSNGKPNHPHLVFLVAFLMEDVITLSADLRGWWSEVEECVCKEFIFDTIVVQ